MMFDLNKERELCNQSFEKYWDDFCEAYGNGFDRSLAKLFFANAWGEAKAQAVPEGYALVSKDKLHEWYCMANRSEELGCPECYESRGYAHNLACELNEASESGAEG
ncbi:hypothetical protein [Acinetobacter baumannii]|uniref:hypothetical protein n=1 Tax=Acinetobacter baumannii TaxID=470 RepID=UPI001D0DF3F2|nr:hypothetical protein [Acinetobacter baumannii]